MGMRGEGGRLQKLNLRCHCASQRRAAPRRLGDPAERRGPRAHCQDARAALFGDRRPHKNLAVRGLFAVAILASGRLFGWDAERHDPPGGSYGHRLSEADRAQSQAAPEDSRRPVSRCSTSSVTKPSTSCAMRLCMPSWRSFSRRAPGYTLYLAIYVKPVRSSSPRSTWLVIDPFRRLIVYPDLWSACPATLVAHVCVGAATMRELSSWA